MESEKLDKAYLDNLQKFGASYHGRYSTFWGRLLANIVDAVLLGLGFWLIGGALGGASAGILGLTWDFFGEVAGYLYAILLHGSFGTTVGKKLMGLKIIDASETKEITFLQAVIRDSFPIVLVAGFFLIDAFRIPGHNAQLVMANIGAAWFLLEILSVLFNKRRRAVHDLLAGTVVVKA